MCRSIARACFGSGFRPPNLFGNLRQIKPTSLTGPCLPPPRWNHAFDHVHVGIPAAIPFPLLGTLGPVNIEPACRGLFVVQRLSDVAHTSQRDKDVALRQKRERQDFGCS
jgi:hypothetical protein